MTQSYICGGCGEPFLAKRARALYCSDRCRMRVKRANSSAAPGQPRLSPIAALDAPHTGIYAVTRAEIEAAGQLNTVIGQQALLIARRLDQDRDTGAGAVALAKELRATMQAATLNAPSKPDFLDELELRRQQRIAEASMPPAPPGPDDLPPAFPELDDHA